VSKRCLIKKNLNKFQYHLPRQDWIIFLKFIEKKPWCITTVSLPCLLAGFWQSLASHHTRYGVFSFGCDLPSSLVGLVHGRVEADPRFEGEAGEDF